MADICMAVVTIVMSCFGCQDYWFPSCCVTGELHDGAIRKINILAGTGREGIGLTIPPGDISECDRQFGGGVSSAFQFIQRDQESPQVVHAGSFCQPLND